MNSILLIIKYTILFKSNNKLNYNLIINNIKNEKLDL